MFPNQAVLGTCNFSGDFVHIFSRGTMAIRAFLSLWYSYSPLAAATTCFRRSPTTRFLYEPKALLSPSIFAPISSSLFK